MLVCFQYLLIFLYQPDQVVSPAPDGGGATGAGGCGGGPENMILMLGMFAVFYFLIFRPQQKQAREREQMLKAVQKGSVVRTSGGIRGEVMAMDDNEITLLVAPKVKLQVARQNIAGVVQADEKSGSSKGEPTSGEAATNA